MNRLGKSLLLTILTIGLAACSSSSDPTPESSPDGSEQREDPPQTPPANPVQRPDDSPTGESVDLPTQEPVDAPEQEPVDTPSEEPAVDILVPNLEQGGDMDRLVRGVTRQASLTILTLNQRLSSGETLSLGENECLGAYDPAFGEQLLAIDCPQPIVVDGSSLRVHRASFYNTDECTASVSAGNTDNCQLESARIDAPVEWSSPASGVPQLIYAGSQIFYAIDNSLLRIESLTGLDGAFRCDIELLDSTQTSTPITGQSCGNTILNTANRIDSVLPEL